jgi:LysR family transcriptional regulator, regulator for bpeEF and oprC
LSFLEDQVGSVLLKKGRRRLTTTDIGQAILDHCERIAAEVEGAGLRASALQTALQGTLRVSMPVDLGVAWLSRAIAAFAQAHPNIHLDIDASSRWVDVSEERYDVAIQLGRIRQSQQLAVRRLARITRGVYASPDYLARRGVPKRIEDFAQYDCIVTEHQRSEGAWTFRSASGAKIIDVAGRVTVNNIAVARELAVGGVGLSMLPNIMCENDVKARRLVRVLTHWESPPLQVSATYLAHGKIPQKLRSFLDFISVRLKESAD